MTSSYPVTLESRFSPRYDRIQVLYRVLWLAAIGLLHQTLGSLFVVLYLILPGAAAIAVTRNREAGFGEHDRDALVAVIDWAVSFYAYLLFVSDRFPSPTGNNATRLVVRPSGAPRVGSALARLLTTLPHAIVLGILGFCAGLVAFAMAVAVLVSEACPEGLRAFQRDVVAWIGRVLAYHASLVETYPPFSLSGGEPTPVRSQ
jgi:hypothetical protein